MLEIPRLDAALIVLESPGDWDRGPFSGEVLGVAAFVSGGVVGVVVMVGVADSSGGVGGFEQPTRMPARVLRAIVPQRLAVRATT